MSPLEKLPVIRKSRQVAWREYRRRTVPKLVFGATIVVLCFLWLTELNSPSLVGQVEPTLVVVNSPKAGLLVDLKLERWQAVKAGDPVGRIVTTDPKVLASSLAVIQAEIQLLKLNLEPARYAMQYDRLRLDMMDHRASLAGMKVKLELAESELRRAQTLSKGKIDSDSAVEQLKGNRDKLKADIEQRAKLVADLEASLGPSGPDDQGSATPAGSPLEILRASIAVQEEKLRLAEAKMSPITLRAPIDGTVDIIRRHSGESVVAGEAIATINAHNSDRIVGYVLQPGSFRLAVGMPVQVRSRFGSKAYAPASVLTIGTQMEPVHPLLLPAASSPAPTLGLPIGISVPESLHLLPGEIVDLMVR